MILLIFTILIILKALEDSLFFKGKKRLSKVIEEIAFALILYSPYFYGCTIEIGYLIAIHIMYVFIRGSIFDFFFNIFSGLSYDYNGSTTYFWDAIMSYFKDWKFWLIRGFFFSLAWIIWYKKIK